jgi:hypothetical protein
MTTRFGSRRMGTDLKFHAFLNSELAYIIFHFMLLPFSPGERAPSVHFTGHGVRSFREPTPPVQNQPSLLRISLIMQPQHQKAGLRNRSEDNPECEPASPHGHLWFNFYQHICVIQPFLLSNHDHGTISNPPPPPSANTNVITRQFMYLFYYIHVYRKMRLITVVYSGIFLILTKLMPRVSVKNANSCIFSLPNCSAW